MIEILRIERECWRSLNLFFFFFFFVLFILGQLHFSSFGD
jgi:hypothetical protein